MAGMVGENTRSMLKVVSYLATLPTKTSPDSGKLVILKAFAQGVTAAGDQGIVHNDSKYLDSDAGVILGWVHDQGKKAPHLQLRRSLVELYQRRKRHVVVIDSNMFLYADRANPHHILRYGFDHVFPGLANYCDRPADPKRWETLQAMMNIQIRPYQTQGQHILICLQRNGGWSMAGYDTDQWAHNTILSIRRVSDRPIVVRNHPGDKSSQSVIKKIQRWVQSHGIANVTYSDSTKRTLVQDLDQCWAMVNHNSSPTVGALIQGVPVFVTDPGRSQCEEVANTDLTMINNPKLFDRDPWLHRIAMFHWSEQEVREGTCWKHMRKYL